MKPFQRPLASLLRSPYVAPSYAVHGLRAHSIKLASSLQGLLDSTEVPTHSVALKKAHEHPWTLPIDPWISIQAHHHIVRRKPLYQGHTKGSIKEKWGQDDHTVVIEGYLIGEEGYPSKDIERLHSYFTYDGPIHILTPLLQAIGLTQFSISQLHLPQTEGQNNQKYTLRAYSDYLDYQWFEDA